jgi:two-component system sensor histidine kinase/response regulator
MSIHGRSLPFTILLVDDREENLLSLEAILAKENRTFIKSDSGNDALKQVLKNEEIGLILLDVQMPGMDGYEVARLLKSNSKTKDISIIFVTAINREEQYILKGFEEGAVDYLQKPLDIHMTQAKVSVFEDLYYYQQQLKTTIAELQKINKQLEKFVYIVAHDLKSPLSGIIGMLGLLKMDKQVAGNPETMEYVTLLSNAAYHLSGMITSLLDHSRKSIGQQSLEDVDVNMMVKEMAILLYPPKNIRITIAGQLPILNTNKLKLQQVLQNLMSNAIKYNDKAKGEIEVGVKDTGIFYEFYVKDNGPGIPVEKQSEVFNLFQTTSNTSAGKTDGSTGVGLNIVKINMAEQGGRIWLDSIPGAGSTFFFEWKK